MKQNFRFEQEKDSSKKQNKQEVIGYILDKDYGTTLYHSDLCKRLGYNFDTEEEFYKYKNMMNTIRRILLQYGRILRSVPNIGYYILKPSQISQHCYRTYIKGAARMFDKSEYVLERTDKTSLNEVRTEEINNMIKLTKSLIENSWNTIKESAYYSRKDYYDNLEDN